MEFNERLSEYADRLESLKESISTEEATKTSMIMPFFQLLGYDIFNPTEFIPEYTADVGIKKHEKVDYAIIIDNSPLILIECKSCQTNLDKHSSQLFRYFGTTDAKFSILTNGTTYRFYTDLEDTNKMDSVPFLTIDLENLKDSDVIELQKFTKEAIDVDGIINSAENLKYSRLIKNWFSNELDSPSPELVKLILKSGVYEGVKNQNTIDKFTPIVKKSTSQFINDLMNAKIKTALAKDSSNPETSDAHPKNDETEPVSKIDTTMVELEAFAIIKSILRKTVDSNRIVYKDTESYFGILLDNNIRKWVCRVYLLQSSHFIVISGDNKDHTRYDIDSIDDIYNYSTEIIESCQKYI